MNLCSRSVDKLCGRSSTFGLDLGRDEGKVMDCAARIGGKETRERDLTRARHITFMFCMVSSEQYLLQNYLGDMKLTIKQLTVITYLV